MMTQRVGGFAILAIVAIGCTDGRVVRDSAGNAYFAKVMSDGRTWTTGNLRLALPDWLRRRRIRMSSLWPFVYVGIGSGSVRSAGNRMAIAN